jgi:ABC-type transport system involved in cytochrome c biogenesis permease subunit
MAQSILFWATVTLYAVATALFLSATAFKKESAAKVGFLVLGIGLAPHLASLVLRWLEVGHGPYSTRYEVVSANVFLLVLVYVVVGLRVPALRGLGVFAAPVSFVAMGWAVASFGVKYEVPIIFKSWWLFLHIGFAKLFGATVLLSASCAAAYLIKTRNADRLPRLPSPVRLEALAHQFLLVSFFFLGVMIVAGSLWAHQSWGRYWGWDPIETSSLVTWIVFGLVLHFKVLHNWSGPRMAYLTFVALAFALATVYVVALVVPTVHNMYLVGDP